MTAIRAARAAQAAFEEFRLQRLPASRSGAPRARCDEVVGRFCFWHQEDPSWHPPPEQPAIQAARLVLLSRLDSLQRASPTDGWITGQRVRYLVEAGRSAEALAAAQSCRALRWWCLALAGYARHAAGDYRGADSVFGLALDAMPPAQRCAWNDLEPVLGDLARRYRRASCAERARLERRIWWLADPLYSVPGNERRTEHYARRLLAALQQQARSAYGVRWGADLEELLLRYGWPVAFEREVAAGAAAGGGAIISHHPPRSWEFLPRARWVEAPQTLGAGDWNLEPERPRSSYAPPYAAAFHPLAHQLARFRRGDSVVVVAAYDVRSDREADRAVRRVEAALVLAPDEDADPLVVRATSSGPTGVLALLAPGTSGLLSLEALDTADSVHASRARYWLSLDPSPDRLALSDPLILAVPVPDSLPASLADAIGLASGAARVSRRQPVGVFWETYGWHRSASPFQVTLTVTPERRSWWSRALGRLGLGRPAGPDVSLRWIESPRAGSAIVPRAIALALGDRDPGYYRIEVRVALPEGPAAQAQCRLELLPD